MQVLVSLVFITLFSITTFSQEKSPAEEAFSDGVFGLIIGEFEEAEANFTIAIEAKEKLAKAHYYRSKARSGQGDYEGALKDINESLEQDPNDHLTIDMRGKIYLALERPKDALVEFNKVLTIDPSFSDIHFSMGRAYKQMSNHLSAISEFDLAIAADPEDSKSYRLRGLSYFYLELDDKACNDLSKARKMGERGLDNIINKYCGNIEIAEENQNTEYDWNFYEDRVIINEANASDFMDFSTDDPESMVKYFYASKIRGDEKWKNVLQSESQWSSRLKYSLDKYEKWKFVNFHLVKKKRHSESGWWIAVYFDIEVNGDTDGGIDEVSLRFNGSEWVITEVPN
ncbi:MAG: tetratricopeptide repeat protein [Crocinitomicaceae bacterium]